MSTKVTDQLIKLTLIDLKAPHVPLLRRELYQSSAKVDENRLKLLGKDAEELKIYLESSIKHYRSLRLVNLRATNAFLRQRVEYLQAILQRKEKVHLLLKVQYLKHEVLYRKISTKNADHNSHSFPHFRARLMMGTEHFSRILSKQHLKQQDPWDGTKYKLLQYNSLYLQLSKKLVIEALKHNRQRRLLCNNLLSYEHSHTGKDKDHLLRICFYSIRQESHQTHYIANQSLLKVHKYYTNKYLRYAFLYYRRYIRYRKKSRLHSQLAVSTQRQKQLLSFFSSLYSQCQESKYRILIHNWSENTNRVAKLIYFYYTWREVYENMTSLKVDLLHRATLPLSSSHTYLNKYIQKTDAVVEKQKRKGVQELLRVHHKKRWSELRRYLGNLQHRERELKFVRRERSSDSSKMSTRRIGEKKGLDLRERLEELKSIYPSYSLDDNHTTLLLPPSDRFIQKNEEREESEGPLPRPSPPTPLSNASCIEEDSLDSPPHSSLVIGVQESVLLNSTAISTPLSTPHPASRFGPLSSLYSSLPLSTPHTNREERRGSGKKAPLSTGKRSVLDRAVHITTNTPPLSPHALSSSAPYPSALASAPPLSSRKYSLREYSYLHYPSEAAGKRGVVGNSAGERGLRSLGKNVGENEEEREEDEIVRHVLYPAIRKMFLKFKVQRLLRSSRHFLRSLYYTTKLHRNARIIREYKQYRLLYSSFQHMHGVYNKCLQLSNLSKQVYDMKIMCKVITSWRDQTRQKKEDINKIYVNGAIYALQNYWHVWRKIYRQEKRIAKQLTKRNYYIQARLFNTWTKYNKVIKQVKDKGYSIQAKQYRHLFALWNKKFHQRKVLKNVFTLYQQRWHERSYRYLPSYTLLDSPSGSSHDENVDTNASHSGSYSPHTRSKASSSVKDYGSIKHSGNNYAPSSSRPSLSRSSYPSEFSFLYNIFHAMKDCLTESRRQRYEAAQQEKAYLFRGYALLNSTFSTWRICILRERQVKDFRKHLITSRKRRIIRAWHEVTRRDMLNDELKMRRRICRGKMFKIFKSWQVSAFQRHYHHPIIVMYEAHFLRSTFRLWKHAYASHLLRRRQNATLQHKVFMYWLSAYRLGRFYIKGLQKISRVLYAYRGRRGFFTWPGRQRSIIASKMSRRHKEKMFHQNQMFTDISRIVKHRAPRSVVEYLKKHCHHENNTIYTYNWPDVTGDAYFPDFVQRCIQLQYVFNYADSFHIQCSYYAIKNILIYWKEYIYKTLAMKKQVYILKNKVRREHIRYIFTHWLSLVPKVSYRILTFLHANKHSLFQTNLYYQLYHKKKREGEYEEIKQRRASRRAESPEERFTRLYGERAGARVVLDMREGKKSPKSGSRGREGKYLIKSSLAEDVSRYEKVQQAPLLAIKYYENK